VAENEERVVSGLQGGMESFDQVESAIIVVQPIPDASRQ
jgi:hypothetical protein